jgi:hypothetical protein
VSPRPETGIISDSSGVFKFETAVRALRGCLLVLLQCPDKTTINIAVYGRRAGFALEIRRAEVEKYTT